MAENQEDPLNVTSKPSVEFITEVEGHFYTYCKVIVRNVIEPVLLALCDRPRFDSQILPRMRTVDSILNAPHFSTTTQESGNHPSVRELVTELKGLKNEVKTIIQIQESLTPTDNRGSMEVLSPLQGIQRTLSRVQNKSSADRHFFSHILTYLCSGLQDIDELFQKLNSGKNVEDAMAVRSKMFDSQTSATTDESSLTALWRVTQEHQEEAMLSSRYETELNQFLPPRTENREPLDIPVHATSSSYLDIGCLSSEEDTSSVSDISGRSVCNRSVTEITKFSKPVTLNTNEGENTCKVGGRSLGPSSTDAFREEVRSRRSMLRNVNSIYLQEARSILHQVLCNHECMCQQPILSSSQADVELMKFAHRESLEKATEMLLKGVLKDVPIEDMFQFKTSEFLLHMPESVEKHKPIVTESAVDSCLGAADRQCYPSSSENCDANMPLKNTSTDSPLLKDDTSKCSLSQSLLDLSLQNFQSKEFTHILQIIKMLRAIMTPLKVEGTNILQEFTKQASDEFFSTGTNSGNIGTCDWTGTLMDLMLEEVVKRVVLKKYEQKINEQRETMEFVSDESLDVLLLGSSDQINSTQVSFSDDLFEEFKPRLTSGGNDSPLAKENSQESGQSIQVAKLQKPDKETEKNNDKEQTSIGLECSPIAPEVSRNKTQSSVIRGDKLCEARISNICLRLAAKSSGNAKASRSSFDKIRIKKSSDSDISVVRKAPTMATQEETGVIPPNQVPSGASNSGTEIDFNESIKSLGQRIVNIERFLSDFDSEDRLREVQRSDSVLENQSSEDRVLKVIEFSSETNQIFNQKSANREARSSSITSVFTSTKNFACENFDCKSFVMADNFTLGNKLPVSSVFYSKIEPDKLPETPTLSKFCFTDAVPYISDTKSVHHLVFTKSNWERLMQDDANVSLAGNPSMLQAPGESKSMSRQGNRVSFQSESDNINEASKTTISTDIDVEMTNSEMKLLTAKRNLPSLLSKNKFSGKLNESDSGMLIHKLRPKASRVPSPPDEMMSKIVMEASDDKTFSTLQKEKFIKTLGEVVSRIEMRPTEMNIIKNVTELAISDGINRQQKPENSFPPKGVGSNKQKRQEIPRQKVKVNSTVETKLADEKFSRNPDRGGDLKGDNIGSTGPTKTDHTLKSSKPGPDKRDTQQSCDYTKKKYDDSSIRKHDKFKQLQSGFNTPQRREQARISRPGKNLKSSRVYSNVLSASSHSFFDESSRNFKNYSENSLNERLMSTSTTALHQEETTTSVLALEPPMSRLSASAPKPPKPAKPLKSIVSTEEAATKPVESDSHERLIKSAFDLMDSCEKILNCKRRSEEMQSATSSHRRRNSLVTVLKTVDEAFVDKMSSCGPGLLFKNQTSQTLEERELLQDDSSEVEERTTNYIEPESKIDVTSSAEPWYGSIREGEFPNKVNSCSTSYLSTGSEIFYDLPTAESDLTYHLEVECGFNQSCAVIERTTKAVTDHKPSTEVDSFKVRKRTGSAPEKYSCHEITKEMTNNKLKAEKPLEEANRAKGRGDKSPGTSLFESCDSEFRTIEFESQHETKLRRCETYVKRVRHTSIRRSASEIFSRRDEKGERVRAGADRCTSISEGRKERSRSRERRKPDSIESGPRSRGPVTDSISSWESREGKYSCSDTKALSIRGHGSLEKQLTLLRDSLKGDCKCRGRRRPGDRPEPECFRPLCRDRRMDEKLRRSLFTGRSGRRKQADLSDTSMDSDISHRFRSDGEKLVAVNADIVMEFFERVYGVYDHIRHCKSCKSLMSRIIEEVICDLAVMRGKA